MLGNLGTCAVEGATESRLPLLLAQDLVQLQLFPLKILRISLFKYYSHCLPFHTTSSPSLSAFRTSFRNHQTATGSCILLTPADTVTRQSDSGPTSAPKTAPQSRSTAKIQVTTYLRVDYYGLPHRSGSTTTCKGQTRLISDAATTRHF